MRITKKKLPLHSELRISNHILEETSEFSDLGLFTSSKLSWNAHVNKITSNANKILGRIKRTCKGMKDITILWTLFNALTALRTLFCALTALRTLFCALTALRILFCALTALRTLFCALTALRTLFCALTALRTLFWSQLEYCTMSCGRLKQVGTLP